MVCKLHYTLPSYREFGAPVVFVSVWLHSTSMIASLSRSEDMYIEPTLVKTCSEVEIPVISERQVWNLLRTSTGPKLVFYADVLNTVANGYACAGFSTFGHFFSHTCQSKSRDRVHSVRSLWFVSFCCSASCSSFSFLT